MPGLDWLDYEDPWVNCQHKVRMLAEHWARTGESERKLIGLLAAHLNTRIQTDVESAALDVAVRYGRGGAVSREECDESLDALLTAEEVCGDPGDIPYLTHLQVLLGMIRQADFAQLTPEIELFVSDDADPNKFQDLLPGNPFSPPV
jgi:hypothetical protein